MFARLAGACNQPHASDADSIIFVMQVINVFGTTESCSMKRAGERTRGLQPVVLPAVASVR